MSSDLTFAARLKSLRAKLGFSQAELAGRLEITRSYLSQLEVGARAGSRKLAAKVAQLERGLGWNPPYVAAVSALCELAIQHVDGAAPARQAEVFDLVAAALFPHEHERALHAQTTASMLRECERMQLKFRNFNPES